MSPGSGQVGIFYKQTEINKDRSCDNVVEWLVKEEDVRSSYVFAYDSHFFFQTQKKSFVNL